MCFPWFNPLLFYLGMTRGDVQLLRRCSPQWHHHHVEATWRGDGPGRWAMFCFSKTPLLGLGFNLASLTKCLSEKLPPWGVAFNLNLFFWSALAGWVLSFPQSKGTHKAPPGSRMRSVLQESGPRVSANDKNFSLLSIYYLDLFRVFVSFQLRLASVAYLSHIHRWGHPGESSPESATHWDSEASEREFGRCLGDFLSQTWPPRGPL